MDNRINSNKSKVTTAKVVGSCQHNFSLVIEIVLEKADFLVKIRIRMAYKIILERKML